jgi:hypothetical protein
MASGGSTLFSLTWNDAVTPSGRRICALRALVRRTPDSGCTSWPTPTVSRGDYSYAHGNHETPTLKLAGAAKTAAWPTPLASDGTASRETFHHGPNNPTLLGAARTAAYEVARLSHWPTPDAHARGTVEPPESMTRESGAKAQLTLHGAAALAAWPTPRAADGAKGGRRRVATGQDLPTTASEVIRAASWATPAAQEAGGIPEAFLERKRKTKAAGTHIGESVTSLSLQAQLVDSGPVPTGPHRRTARRPAS